MENGGQDFPVRLHPPADTLHVLRLPSPWSLTAGFAERVKDALTSLLPGR